MAKQYDRACLINLMIKRTPDGTKSLLEGATIHLEDALKVVELYDYDSIENRMYVKFIGDTDLTHLPLDTHYVVDVPEAVDDEMKHLKKKGAKSKKTRN